ncbi:MAG: hypothetical protein KC636_26365 [Myxococcales bacterium]|nr:hypothetical protein [Myxococcales bacterium]
MHLKLAVTLSLTGVVMALGTSLIGLQGAEFFLWMGFYVLWIAATLRVRPDRPFLTLLVASVLSGLWTGLFQLLLRDQYVAHNPAYAADFAALADASTLEWAMSFVGFGLAAGLVFGLVVGAIGWGLARRGYLRAPALARAAR